jgi:hypothetical protein
VNTDTRAQTLVIKVYGKDSGSKAWNIDLAKVTLNYYLN